MPPDGDLAAARAAVSEALGKSGRDASVPWEDPATGARGTVTPLSNAYSQDGTTCRDFLASYVRNGVGILAAGRGLPRPPGPLGGAPDAALAADLSARSVDMLRAAAPLPTFDAMMDWGNTAP